MILDNIDATLAAAFDRVCRKIEGLPPPRPGYEVADLLKLLGAPKHCKTLTLRMEPDKPITVRVTYYASDPVTGHIMTTRDVKVFQQLAEDFVLVPYSKHLSTTTEKEPQ